MPVKVERIGNEPILVMHFTEPFKGEVDVQEANEATAQLLKKISGGVYRIENVKGIDLDFSKMVAGLSSSKTKIAGSMADPNVYGIFVGAGEIPEMTAKSFAQEQYGGKETPFFSTVQQAIAHARKQMK